MNEFDDYIQQLGGPNGENAFHSLIEADATVVPALITAYRAERSSRKRAILIEIIGYYRQPNTVDFLAEALQEKDPDIWKAALDGFVTLNDPVAPEVLISASAQRRKMGDTERAAWIDEAIQQLRDNLDGTDHP